MRSVNFAQQCANVIASMQDRAVVVGNNAALLLHLLHALLGTSSKRLGYERPMSTYWSPRGWFAVKQMPMLKPTMRIATTATITSQIQSIYGS